MPKEATQKKAEPGPPQKAPGYDDTIDRDTGHDPAIDDPDSGLPPVSDPDTEGQMGQPDAETPPERQNPKPGE